MTTTLFFNIYTAMYLYNKLKLNIIKSITFSVMDWLYSFWLVSFTIENRSFAETNGSMTKSKNRFSISPISFYATKEPKWRMINFLFLFDLFLFFDLTF
jgi:hypothetical protein